MTSANKTVRQHRLMNISGRSGQRCRVSPSRPLSVDVQKTFLYIYFILQNRGSNKHEHVCCTYTHIHFYYFGHTNNGTWRINFYKLWLQVHIYDTDRPSFAPAIGLLLNVMQFRAVVDG